MTAVINLDKTRLGRGCARSTPPGTDVNVMGPTTAANHKPRALRRYPAPTCPAATPQRGMGIGVRTEDETVGPESPDHWPASGGTQWDPRSSDCRVPGRWIGPSDGA